MYDRELAYRDRDGIFFEALFPGEELELPNVNCGLACPIIHQTSPSS